MEHGTAAMYAARLRECERARDELGAEVERLARELDEGHVYDSRDEEIGRLTFDLGEARAAIDAVAANRARWEQRTAEARAELRRLVDALGMDDGPRAAAIQRARAVLEEWGTR
jgi:hypothetical protein